jgi:phage terminase large subunit-like protein
MKKVIAQAQKNGYPFDVRVLETTRTIEFSNGSLIEFKTAVDPDGLRGAGLDILWMDEAAFIPNAEAYMVVFPALSDKEGITLTTTTPAGKNWFYDRFWSEKALAHARMGRVEYRSLDNPYFSKEEWLEVQRDYHPMLFKQEFMAAFDAMQGRELLGDWLKYYTLGDAQGDKIGVPRIENSKELNLRYYIGVDPAISLADTADRFSISVLGVTPDSTQVYLIDNWAGRIPFPEQVDKIQEWFLKWKQKGLGVQFVAVESNAYQNALVQQLERLPSLPPIVPIVSKGKKHERILRMAPLFRIGKVRIREDQRDFIDEWLDYDSLTKNPKDDVLDSVEIALSVASVMHAEMPKVTDDFDFPAGDANEWAKRDLPGRSKFRSGSYDEAMGDDW